MIRYVPTNGQTTAALLSEALWALSRPPQVRNERDTLRLFPQVTCTDESVWLVVEVGYDIPVHAEAELGDIEDILQPWIDAGLLHESEPETLRQAINAHKGQRMVVYDQFPQLFKDQSKTRGELVAAGLIIESTL
jgi:hypothetical protein